MTPVLRSDRSLILYPSPQADRQLLRRERFQALRSLREARRVYHFLCAGQNLTDSEALQIQWRLRELAAGLGTRLVIAGATSGALGFSELH